MSNVDQSAKDAARAILASYELLLADLETALETYGDPSNQSVPPLFTWLMAGFEDEWRLITESDRLVRSVISSAERGDLLVTAKDSVALLELHFGPMREPTQACERALAPLGKVTVAMRSGSEQAKTLLAQVRQLRDDVVTWKGTVDTTAQDARDAVDAALLESDVADFLSKSGVEKDFSDARKQLDAAPEALSKVLADLQTGTTRFRDDLASDLALVQSFAASAATLESGQCAALGELKDVHRDLRALIEHRRLMLWRLETNLRKLVTSTDELLANDVVKVGLGAGLAESVRSFVYE